MIKFDLKNAPRIAEEDARVLTRNLEAVISFKLSEFYASSIMVVRWKRWKGPATIVRRT